MGNKSIEEVIVDELAKRTRAGLDERTKADLAGIATMQDLCKIIQSFDEEKAYYICDMGHCDVVISPKGMFRKKMIAVDVMIKKLKQKKEECNIRPVPIAEWIEVENSRAFKCSRCGREEPQREPYCHCGAQMKG